MGRKQPKVDKHSKAMSNDNTLRMGNREIENFHEDDFKLPMEELVDGRLSHSEATLQKKQLNRINLAKKKLYDEKKIIKTLDSNNIIALHKDEEQSLAKSLKGGASINTGNYSIGEQRLRKTNYINNGYDELKCIKRVIGNNYNKLNDVSKKTLKDYEEESK